jgi:DNA-binding transcriptional LysR family regulator
MKLQSLKYFCVLAEELHFGRAASRLAISQPPLSTAIRSLEEEVGATLFVRNSKLVQLTPAGAACLVEAREILERVGRVASVARAVDAGLHGRLDIGMTSSLLYRDMPVVLSEFNREVPGVDIVLHELSTSEQIDKVKRRQLHAAFVQGSARSPDLQSLPLRNDFFVACLPEAHPLAAKATLALRELASESFILFSRDSAPASHDHVIGVFSRYEMHPRIVHAAQTWMTIVAMVAQGCGVALTPESMSRVGIRGVHFSALEGPPSPIPASLVWNASNMPVALESFLASATKTIRRLKAERTVPSRGRSSKASSRPATRS